MRKNEFLEAIENCINEAWKGVKKDFENNIWWDEQEIVASFYHYLRQREE